MIFTFYFTFLCHVYLNYPHAGPATVTAPSGYQMAIVVSRTVYSRDRIWPWQLSVKGKGQRYPSQCSIQLTHFLSVSHQGILSIPVPFVPWQSGLPFPWYNLTLKIQGQRSRSNVKVKGTLVSVASSWLISFLFHINWTNHSYNMANKMLDWGKRI